MARTIAKDHDEKRRLILTRAARIFAEDGFDRASVSRVAQACEISKANIYHYYSSKDDILFDILGSYLSALRDRICEMDIAALPPAEQLSATVREIMLAYQGADDEHRLQASSIRYLPPAQQTVLRSYQVDLVRHVDNIIANIAPEVFDGDKNKLRATTMSIYGMLNWFYMWNHGADTKAREDYADLVSKLALGGIAGL
ncbi:TetR/AcrR family transcriptional regulator [Aliiroseovarius sp. YM-037]|uniref:TetR/AcrR family transcriptional regulator n=1 Tax=Aliiroseovarius sp. YM-037 TaxID=3341728 RepID=UPI003A7F9A9A